MVNRPGFLFECKLEQRGASTLVKSDATWKSLRAPMWTEDVPCVSGAPGFTELYDANKEVPGWNLPGYDDKQWKYVHLISRNSGDNVPLMDPHFGPSDDVIIVHEARAPSHVLRIHA